ncbi:MAG TPA: M28 family peptidase [Chitinophagales bacterium]|nr:M28 family peptidase [Chitinophagales bacterium]
MKKGLTLKLIALFLLAVLGAYVFMLAGKNGFFNRKDHSLPPPKTTLVSTPSFNADSAFYFLQKQVAFGPRVPNTTAHVNCGNWLDSILRQSADTVYLQTGQVTAYDGTKLNFKNIIASFNPETKQRIFLCAHWDTRPFADQDPDADKRKLPNDGADDGASGVAVLIEVARALKQQPVKIGLDLILFDVEDYGQPDEGVSDKPDTYCLGSQYWAKNPHVPNYKAQYGILLDMVGAKGASFPMEAYSQQFAPSLLRRVWNNGVQLGYSNYFQFKESKRPVIDDHYYIHKIAGFPVINIIHIDPDAQKMFGDYWHTHKDNLSLIDKNTLKAVGQTILQTVYQEDAGVM